MPKKPPPNGYYFFMLDFKKREERNGRRFHGGMTEVATAASDEWKALHSAEKERYNKLAKERRNDPRPNVSKPDEKKYNSQGISFAVLKQEKAKAEEKLKRESNFISQFVNDMSPDDLRRKLIYLIHVNIFCKTDSDIYYPAEIGIVKFNLEDGVKDIFHRYIDPGEIATGYSYAVKEHTELTHKLTLQYVRSVPGTSDLQRLYRDICQFLTVDEPEGDENNLPPLFTMYDDVILNTSLNAARKTIKNLWETVYTSHDDDEDYWERYFKVLPLPEMFHRLKNKCAIYDDPNTIAFPNPVLPKIELQKDTYNYNVSTACKFHRDEDVIVHCSQSFVVRWAFIIRDHCTHLIGIDMFKNTVPKCKYNSKKYGGYEEEDDTSSLADSFQSIKISEASIDFSNTDSRTKRGSANSFGSSRKKRDEDDDEYSDDRNSVASSSYASTSNTGRKKDAGEYEFADGAKDQKSCGSYAASFKEDKLDTDLESVANQSTKSCPVAWPVVNRRPQTVPAMTENNFPSLGRGRGSLRNLRPN